MGNNGAKRPQRSDGVQVTVKTLRGETKEVKVCETVEQLCWITVRQLKEKIKQKFGITHPDDIRLIFTNKLLDDDLYLSHYGVQHGSTLHMRLTLRRTERPQTGVHVIVITLTETKEVKVCETVDQLQSITVLQLREKIQQKFGLPPDLEQFPLIFAGKQLIDDQYLSHYGVQHGSTLFVIPRLITAERPQTEVHVTVKTLTETKEVKVCETVEQLQSITVLQLKEKIKQEFGLHPDDIRLIFMGKLLIDDQYLSHYGVQHGSTLYMVLRPQMEVHVTVKTLRGETKKVKVCETEEQLQSITVLQLKEKIKQEFGLPPDLEQFRLIFAGKQLMDDQYLSHYGVQHGSTLIIIFRLRRAERPQSSDRPQTGVYATVKTLRGETKEVKVCETEEQLQTITFQQLGERIRQEFDPPHPDDFSLIFQKELLDDDDDEYPSDCCVQHGSVLHMSLTLRRAERPQTTDEHKMEDQIIDELYLNYIKAIVSRWPRVFATRAKEHRRRLMKKRTDGEKMKVQVFVKGLTGEIKLVDVCETAEQLQIITVLQLKERILLEFGLTHLDEGLALTFQNRWLKDDQYLSDYGIQHGSHINVTSRLSGGERPPPDDQGGGRGDRGGRRRSMEKLALFRDGSGDAGGPSSGP